MQLMLDEKVKEMMVRLKQSLDQLTGRLSDLGVSSNIANRVNQQALNGISHRVGKLCSFF